MIMLEFLPDKLKGLSGTPLYASIIWLTLIFLTPLIIILTRILKNYYRKSSNNKRNKLKKEISKDKIRTPKGF